MTKKPSGLLLAQDPGTVNHGVAVIDPSEMTILAHGLNPYTLTMLLPGVSKQARDYENFLMALQERGCEYAIAERFQTRGLLGLSIELVSAMLGITLRAFPGKTRLVIASQWKNAYKRSGLELDQFYVEMRPITPHQIDASLMGLWMACRLRNLPLLSKKTLARLLTSADQPSKEQIRSFLKDKVRPKGRGKRKRKAK